MPVLPSSAPALPPANRLESHQTANVIERANQYPIIVRTVSKNAKSVIFQATNLTKQTVRSFAGVVRVFDPIGNEIVDIAVEDDAPLAAGASANITEQIQATKGNELAEFFVNADNKILTYVYLPTRVIDARGRVHYVKAISPGGK